VVAVVAVVVVVQAVAVELPMQQLLYDPSPLYLVSWQPWSFAMVAAWHDYAAAAFHFLHPVHRRRRRCRRHLHHYHRERARKQLQQQQRRRHALQPLVSGARVLWTTTMTMTMTLTPLPT
jgi:hypothetical protein